jgi:hypothetical protein
MIAAIGTSFTAELFSPHRLVKVSNVRLELGRSNHRTTVLMTGEAG